MSTALRIVAVVLWIAFLVGMASWSETTPALVLAALGTVVVGVLVARWWLPLAVVVPGVILALIFLSAGTEEHSDGSGADWAAGVGIWTAAIAGALALGVACQRLTRR
jgi:hypothetical protein